MSNPNARQMIDYLKSLLGEFDEGLLTSSSDFLALETFVEVASVFLGDILDNHDAKHYARELGISVIFDLPSWDDEVADMVDIYARVISVIFIAIVERGYSPDQAVYYMRHSTGRLKLSVT